MSQTKPAIRFDSLRDGARPYPKKCQTPYPPPLKMPIPGTHSRPAEWIKAFIISNIQSPVKSRTVVAIVNKNP